MTLAERVALMRAEERTSRVLELVREERARQREKWGVRDWPDGTGGSLAVSLAEDAKASCEENFAAGVGTFADILAEEVAEAFAESDPKRLAEELVQVAAVACQWVEMIGGRS